MTPASPSGVLAATPAVIPPDASSRLTADASTNARARWRLGRWVNPDRSAGLDMGYPQPFRASSEDGLGLALSEAVRASGAGLRPSGGREPLDVVPRDPHPG